MDFKVAQEVLGWTHVVHEDWEGGNYEWMQLKKH